MWMLEPPAKRSKGISHNKTKVQQAKVSNQLLIRAAEFDQKTRLLLAESNHGIPSLTEIKLNGRRVQDKANLASQIAAEKASAANLTCEKLTTEIIQAKASATTLSNDRLMRLGEERLSRRIKISEMSTQKFWLDLKIPDGNLWYRYVMGKAWVCYPLLTKIIYRKKNAKPVRTKTEAKNIIGEYLQKSKNVSKLICEFAYGKKGTDKAVPKRERHCEPGDILDYFGFFNIVEGVFGEAEEICEAAALTVLSHFELVDPHYTYTLPQSDNILIEEDNDDDDDIDEPAQVSEEISDDQPRFVSVT